MKRWLAVCVLFTSSCGGKVASGDSGLPNDSGLSPDYCTWMADGSVIKCPRNGTAACGPAPGGCHGTCFCVPTPDPRQDYICGC